MTALEKYARLEALGQWQETPDTPPREVIVSFGNAALLLSNQDETPITHWAMAATMRISLDTGKAVYTPDTQGFETLTIDDAQMIEAIAQVSKAEQNRQSGLRLWPLWFGFFLIATIASIAIYYGPNAMREQAVKITTTETARHIGLQMLTTLGTEVCRAPNAEKSLSILKRNLFADNEHTVVITRNGPAGIVFPGGLLAIGNTAFRQFDTPEEAAIWMAILAAEHDNADIIESLFHDSNLTNVFYYLRTGSLSQSHLERAADRMMQAAILAVPPLETPNSTGILRDHDWDALQNICLN